MRQLDSALALPTPFPGKPKVIDRFDTRDALVQALRRQQIVQGDLSIAEALADVSSLRQYEIVAGGNVLIRQGDSDNDLFLILAGKVAIWINGQELAIRQACQHVGELALIDTSARRSADVIAIEQTVTAVIRERDFSPIADRNPSLWRQIALELGNRLRERSKYVRTPNPRPVLFIGSSAEGLPIAREIQSLFAHDDLLPKPWTDCFRPSASSIENLEREVAAADFAILVLGPDDVVESRGTVQDAPRDNVVWEHGFFTGGLGRGRCFLVKPRGASLKLPSDWGGVTILDYDAAGTLDDLSSRLGSVVHAIRKEIVRLGTRRLETNERWP